MNSRVRSCFHIAQLTRSVGHIFAYLYTLDDDSERPMDYETFIDVFPQKGMCSLIPPHLDYKIEEQFTDGTGRIIVTKIKIELSFISLLVIGSFPNIFLIC